MRTTAWIIVGAALAGMTIIAPAASAHQEDCVSYPPLEFYVGGCVHDAYHLALTVAAVANQSCHLVLSDHLMCYWIGLPGN